MTVTKTSVAAIGDGCAEAVAVDVRVNAGVGVIAIVTVAVDWKRWHAPKMNPNTNTRHDEINRVWYLRMTQPYWSNLPSLYNFGRTASEAQSIILLTQKCLSVFTTNLPHTMFPAHARYHLSRQGNCARHGIHDR